MGTGKVPEFQDLFGTNRWNKGKNIDRIRDLMTPSSKTYESVQTAQIMSYSLSGSQDSTHI